jgi:hypothetical protein
LYYFYLQGTRLSFIFLRQLDFTSLPARAFSFFDSTPSAAPAFSLCCFFAAFFRTRTLAVLYLFLPFASWRSTFSLVFYFTGHILRLEKKKVLVRFGQL